MYLLSLVKLEINEEVKYFEKHSLIYTIVNITRNYLNKSRYFYTLNKKFLLPCTYYII